MESNEGAEMTATAAARRDRTNAARFDAFAARVESRITELGLDRAGRERYRDTAFLVYCASNRQR